VHHCYWLQLSHQWRPDTSAAPTSTPAAAAQHDRTSWTDCLQHPTHNASAMRLSLTRPRLALGLPLALQDTMYRVACDALHSGDRCSKKGHTRGNCDLCWFAFGSRTPETLAHLLLDCPFSAPVTQAAHRALIRTTSKVATAAVSRSLAALPSAAFTHTFYLQEPHHLRVPCERPQLGTKRAPGGRGGPRCHGPTLLHFPVKRQCHFRIHPGLTSAALGLSPPSGPG
jgi:hypothetical protein